MTTLLEAIERTHREALRTLPAGIEPEIRAIGHGTALNPQIGAVQEALARQARPRDEEGQAETGQDGKKVTRPIMLVPNRERERHPLPDDAYELVMRGQLGGHHITRGHWVPGLTPAALEIYDQLRRDGAGVDRAAALAQELTRER